MHQETVTGLLRLHPRGFGFVVPDEDGDDIFIPKHLTDNAVDGDRVEVLLSPPPWSPKGPDGKIVAILERGRKKIAGIIIEKNRAFSPLLGTARPIEVKEGEKLKTGDRAIFAVEDWGDKKHPVIATFQEKIGHINQASTDVPAATEEFELFSTFPKPVIEEAKTFGKQVQKKDLKNRKDLSSLPCITIDPETAKDFDDALSIKKEKNGHFLLGVHIADAAHYVQPGSHLDAEALKRGNSTYFPGTCLPMLPEELSNNLCSLREGVIRLTVSVLMEFNQQGDLKDVSIVRAFIKSRKRLTYGQAKKILDGKQNSPHKKALQSMKELCLLLKTKRAERGSIDFALPELILLIDKQGNPTGTKIEEYDITHQLVEEFMLKANEVVAETLTKRGKSPIYRVHDEPEKENMEEFASFARTLGFALPKKPTQSDYQELFAKAKKTPHSHQLAVSFIRNMKLASYSQSNVGHFGLALEYYCHFTSPIRRYSDLVTQRLLFDEEEKEADLAHIADMCSERERISFRAEMSVKALKKYRLLSTWLKEDPKRAYKATITRVKHFGIAFEITDLFLEGFLHISQLDDDYYHYNETNGTLKGKATGKLYTTGSTLSVRPTQIDLIHQEASFELASTQKKTNKKKRKKR